MKSAASRIRTIIVVDDEPDFANMVKSMLEEHDYRVHTRHNGRDGIETILALRPDLVILDVLMPVIQGYDVCRYLKSQTGLCDTKVIFLSSLSKELDKRWGMTTGADAYLTKPVSSEKLIETVKSVLGD
jgi:DNA-binding response OmpR family regulator